VRAFGRLFLRRFKSPKARAISGSSRFREALAFLIQRGGIFALNLRKPLTGEPELASKSFASLGISPLVLGLIFSSRRYSDAIVLLRKSSAARGKIQRS
jgi:hypothetical protein